MSRPSRSGLPSGPGPRSRSAVRNRYDDDGDRSQAPSQSRRQVRPQKSLNSMRSESQPPPPMPSRSRPSFDTRPSDSNRSSDSTASSNSSFLDRMRGYASSRTSLDDEPPPKPSARSMRSRPSRAETPPPVEDDDDNEPPPQGDGFTLWSKVASAASSLTVNVGKAWTSNVTTFSGEETPPGQESRLTRAMKAYHIEKARDPSDLPGWLFDEKERRRPAPASSRSSSRHDEVGEDDRRPTRAEPLSSRGLRDIAAASSKTYDRSTRAGRSYADDTPQPSRATDRLKALRDAKRSAVNPNVMQEEERAKETPRVEPEVPRRRVGLPSGPISRR
ncbi:hypothetical protein MIND_01035100 [Mycena indigotica]|uniref:Uncharacterized protein n=1 Tax=Mycena indigotica TaxID=2126181 RepID=A0A8H6SBU3_9AGAR|nr:uncharacterized protein MIND_01035100 [Mycena indigotica]KAF7294970.1 hypothetical protein MIND_01035100 [Mycena indigotica]